MLNIGKTRFFAILKHRQAPDAFSIAYERHTPGRLSADIEAEIEHELLREKEGVEDKRLPISSLFHPAVQNPVCRQHAKDIVRRAGHHVLGLLPQIRPRFLEFGKVGADERGAGGHPAGNVGIIGAIDAVGYGKRL